jgi:hypothetical protein
MLSRRSTQRASRVRPEPELTARPATSAGCAHVGASLAPACPRLACGLRDAAPAAAPRYTTDTAYCGSCGSPPAPAAASNAASQTVDAPPRVPSTALVSPRRHTPVAIAHRTAIGTDDRTGPPLTDPVRLTRSGHRGSASSGRHHFLDVMSFSNGTSSIASASSFFGGW